MYFKLYEFNGTNYAYSNTIKLNEVISYSFTANDFPNYNVLEMELKPTSKALSYTASNKTELANLKPLILTKEINGNVIWFAFIISREVEMTTDNKVVKFNGCGFTFFETKKLIASNKDYPTVPDPQDLPDDFAKYQRTATLKQHLEYFYDTAFLNPKQLTYGVLASVNAPIRRFKGLNSVVIDYTNTTTANISLDQTNVLDCKKEVYERFGIELQTIQTFNNTTGLIDLKLQAPTLLSNEVIRRNDDLLERIYGNQSTNNYVFGYADPNNVVNLSYVLNSDFTTREVSEDFQFIAGANNEYLTNASNTKLKEYIRDNFIQLFKIKPATAFTEIKVGDLAKVRDLTFRIRKLRETNSISGISFDIDIEEV